MAFTGKYQLESRENYDEFIAKTGLKKAEPGVKVVTEVVQDGDNFSWKHGMPGWSWNAKFTLGEECDMKSMGGVPFKGTVTMNDGKLCLQFPEYSFTGEMIDDKLVTYCKTTGEDGVTLKTVSARI